MDTLPRLPDLRLRVQATARLDVLLLAELRLLCPGLSRAQLKEAFRIQCILISRPGGTTPSAARGSHEIEPGEYHLFFENWDPARLTQRNALPSSAEDEMDIRPS